MEGKTRGTDIVAIRKILKKQPPKYERDILSQLNSEQREIFDSTDHNTWNLVVVMEGICQVVTRVIYPFEVRPGYQLGKDIAEKSMNSIYRMFLKIPTIAYLVRRTAQIWYAFFDKGIAISQIVSRDKNPKSLLEVSGFPEMPEIYREVVAGHICYFVEMTGAKEVSVDLGNDYGPEKWQWLVNYQ
jgi:hypothetical protein